MSRLKTISKEIYTTAFVCLLCVNTALGSSKDISITATFSSNNTLQTSAILEVYLVDISVIDGSSIVLSKKQISPILSHVINFTLSFNPENIEKGGKYIIEAKIRENASKDRVLFRTTQSYPVNFSLAVIEIDIHLMKMR